MDFSHARQCSTSISTSRETDEDNSVVRILVIVDEERVGALDVVRKVPSEGKVDQLGYSTSNRSDKIRRGVGAFRS